jgi:uncharacterized membrane protein YccC
MNTADTLPPAFPAGPIRSVAGWIWNMEFVAPPWRAPLAFSLRCWIATILAFYVAFYLQLEAPYWAGLTIWFVAQPTPGMAISRGFYRILGTLVGAAVGVALMGLFAQTPELFIFMLALWLGATTVASNLLRNFRAYGAALAGYTTAIVALGAYTNPDHVFDIAFARGSSTVIAIACSALVTTLFAPHRTYGRTMTRLRQVVAQAARRASIAPASPLAEKLVVGKPLLAELIALDAEIDFAAAEAAQFRLHVNTARSLLAHLFGAIAAKRSMDARIVRAHLLSPDLLEAIAVAESLFQSVTAEADKKQSAMLAAEMENLRASLAAFVPENSGRPVEEIISERVIVDRLDDLLRHLARAGVDLASLEGGPKAHASLRLNFHRDNRAALINGSRAFLAVALAGAFWIASAWSSGPGMVIMTATVCTLFSALPRPDRAGIAFLMGTFIALPAAFIWNFFIFQNISGFPLFALAVGLYIIPVASFFLNPKTSLYSIAACVFFFAISRPTNPMNFDIISFLNNAVSAIVGVAFGVLAYKLFLPPDPPAARRYVIHRIRIGLGLISSLQPIPEPWRWQTRMFDRVNRLYDPANPSGTSTDEWFEGGLAAVELGNEILRLRFILDEEVVDPTCRASAEKILVAFSQRHPRTRTIIRETLAGFPGAVPPLERESPQTWVRMRGILQEMEAFFTEHPRFLTP